MKYKLCDIENLFARIKEILRNYEGYYEYNKRYTLYLASGDAIFFKFNKGSIAHLLGINTTYLSELKLFNSTDSYDILKEMVEHPYLIYRKETEQQLSYDKLFSEYIWQKLSAFEMNKNINIFDTELVCLYNSERTYHIFEDCDKCDCIIVKKGFNGEIGVLTLVKNDGIYSPMSNRIYESYEDAKKDLAKFLKNQTITFATGLEVNNSYSNFKRNFNIPLDKKGYKVNTLERYADEFDSTIDVHGDYKYSLKKGMFNNEAKSNENDLIQEIAFAISQGEVIESSDYRMQPIIDAFNNYLTRNEESKVTPYSKLKAELMAIRNDAVSLQDKYANSETERALLIEENGALKADNASMADALTQIEEILNKQKTK